MGRAGSLPGLRLVRKTVRGAHLDSPSSVPSVPKTPTKLEWMGEDMPDQDTTKTEVFEFQAEVTELLDLVVHSLYSNTEIFLRELISNASDAIDRFRFRALTDTELRSEELPLEIRLRPDEDAGTLTIEDTGLGMTKDELKEDLGTIARSGTRAFLSQIKEQAESADARFIGQFGVGFYSAFLVSDRVEVTSRAAGSDEAWTWSSDAKGSFSIEPAERAERGTTIVLHLKEDERRFTEPWTIRNLVKRYSDFVAHPIRLFTKPGEDDDEAKEPEKINQGKALWLRPKSEIEDGDYAEFYRHVSHDFGEPLAWTHFKVEGTQLFTGLLYLPKTPPFDLYRPEQRRGVRLYVKRVFVMEECDELVPQWLRFLRGVVDSDDLPLNVSREILQDSRIAKTIRKQVVKKTLDLLETLAKAESDDDKAKFVTFWEAFGAVFKEGLFLEHDMKQRIAKLARYKSSTADGWTSLSEYVERMPEDQKAIYYITGRSTETLAGSPHLEALRKRGWEVLYMTDPVDEVATDALSEFDDKPLVHAMKADLQLGDDDEAGESDDAKEETPDASALIDRMTTALGDRVESVRASKRLTDSPVCLVVPEGAMSPHMEALLRAHTQDLPDAKRILEVNPDHAIIKALGEQLESDGFDEWVEVLYEQALITEGSALPDPNAFARRVTRLLEKVVA